MAGEGGGPGKKAAPRRSARRGAAKGPLEEAMPAGPRAMTVVGPRPTGPKHGTQLKRVRINGWTPARRVRFLETLAATCNVSEAARVAGRDLSGAYALRRRDPGFARDWQGALAEGYAELEALLLRQSLFGCEQEDVVMDGEGAVKSRKVRRAYPHNVAVRLLLAHRATALSVREREMHDRPDGEDAVARLRAALKQVRGRTVEAGASEGE